MGERLRAIRLSRGLSLKAAARVSEGRFKASTLGAYERGERSISVGRLPELAGLYGVEVAELLPDGEAQRIIDLREVSGTEELLAHLEDVVGRLRHPNDGPVELRSSDRVLLSALRANQIEAT
jgi:transcriptional regulator with XRE-family HTH domain